MSIVINAYCTHRLLPPLTFPHELHSCRDRRDPELCEHLNRLMEFVAGPGEREMTQTLYQVMRHIQRVQHHLSLHVAEDDLDAFSQWAIRANAICFLPDKTVRDPAGLVLVDPENNGAEEEADVPFPEDAQNRKLKSERFLGQQGVYVKEELPPVIGEIEVALRSADEVAVRCLGLFVVALHAESLASDHEISFRELQEKFPLAMGALSPKELEFMQAAVPSQQDILEHTGRYEALFLLQWALGLHRELPFPNQVCDVALVARVMFDSEMQQHVGDASLRTTGELLDALDSHFRFHWTTRQELLHQGDVPGGLLPEVVAERHYALNWLTQFEEADWDDVDTPTDLERYSRNCGPWRLQANG